MLKWLFGFDMLPLLAADGGTGGGGDGGAGGDGNGGGQDQTGGSPGGGQASGGQATPTQHPAQGKVFTEDYVRALREEAAGHRTRAKALESAIRKAMGLNDDAVLPDNLEQALGALREQGKQQAQQVEAQAKQALLKAAFISAAAGKVADVDDAFVLASQELADTEVDLKSGTVKVKPGKDGKERNMADLVAALLERKPHLRAGGGGGAGGTTPPGGGSGKETPEQIAQRIAQTFTPQAPKRSLWGK